VVLAALPVRSASALAIRRVGSLEADGGDVGDGAADHLGGREQGSRQRSVAGNDDPERPHPFASKRMPPNGSLTLVVVSANIITQ